MTQNSNPDLQINSDIQIALQIILPSVTKIIGSDCMRSANKSPKTPYSAMVIGE